MKQQIKNLFENIFNQKVRKYSYKYRLAHLFETFEIENIIDVGANTGQFILWAKSSFNKRVTDVYSFEPLSFAFNELSENAKLYKKLFIWHVYPFALSDKEGTAKINISAGDGTSSSLHDITQNSKVKNVGIEEISLKVFDCFDDGFSEKNNFFVKIDVQGHESHVLTGMSQFIMKKRPLILVEIANLSSYQGDEGLREFLNYFENIDYRLLWIEHNITDVLFDREWDLCFIPKERFPIV